MPEALNLIMRWLHITSAVTLVGGLIYASLVEIPAAAALAPDFRDAVSRRASALFRPLVYGAITGLLVSGLYTLATHPGHSIRYHIVLGIKLLLALHVFAVAIIVAKGQPAERRSRLLKGAFISGLIVIALANYLHQIF